MNIILGWKWWCQWWWWWWWWWWYQWWGQSKRKLRNDPIGFLVEQKWKMFPGYLHFPHHHNHQKWTVMMMMICFHLTHNHNHQKWTVMMMMICFHLIHIIIIIKSGQSWWWWYVFRQACGVSQTWTNAWCLFDQGGGWCLFRLQVLIKDKNNDNDLIRL